MQNADDAGATKVTFCLDNRQHGTASLAYEKLAPFQGPALYVHNNSVFSEADFQSISRIGDSGKREQAGKTGKEKICRPEGLNQMRCSCHCCTPHLEQDTGSPGPWTCFGFHAFLVSSCCLLCCTVGGLPAHLCGCLQR